jgi:hypothetical protein
MINRSAGAETQKVVGRTHVPPAFGLDGLQDLMGGGFGGRLARAGDRTRTGDVQLGKLAFYQLNYARDSPLC